MVEYCQQVARVKRHGRVADYLMEVESSAYVKVSISSAEYSLMLCFFCLSSSLDHGAGRDHFHINQLVVHVNFRTYEVGLYKLVIESDHRFPSSYSDGPLVNGDV